MLNDFTIYYSPRYIMSKQTDETDETDSSDDELSENPKKETRKEKINEKQRREDREKINEGGTFQVQVHIIQGKKLLGKDPSGLSDPIIKVTIGNESKSTMVRKNTKNPKFDQILSFELKDLGTI